MRYHYEKPPVTTAMYGEIYICNHPIYNQCTLFRFRDGGLALIQQRYDRDTKHTWWQEVEPWLADRIYLQKGFQEYLEKHAGSCTDGLYPTVTVRQAMWALRMKPLARECWETVFDHKPL